MSFNTALSGLNAAQSELSVTSHNIANVNTVGFKESRAQFGDIFAVSALGSGSTAVGSGVIMNKVAQQFTQGNLDFTNAALDMAISGEGLFVLSPESGSQERVYTRGGEFSVDSQGFVTNSAGQYLQTFPVNADGTVSSSSLTSTAALKLPSTAGTPNATTEVEVGVNLPGNSSDLDPLSFDPNQTNTFTSSTSVTIYDSLGESHIATMYYVKDQNVNNQWAVYHYVDNNPVDISGGVAGANGQLYSTMLFDNAGSFNSSTPATVQTAAGEFAFLSNGADQTQQITFDYANNSPTQFASPFLVNTLSQDGFTTGRLTGLDISDNGVIRANFSNGESEALGKVALARFSNPQGLTQLGNTVWRESLESGPAVSGEAGTGSFGLIRSGAVESSNVDLTAELVNLITAQRNFQANARAIETNNAVTQTIIQIR
jgi:flagellar hook protein FlgE